MSASAEEKTGSKGCLKGCAIGCGVIFILGLVLLIGGPLIMTRPFRNAIETRQELEQRLGEQGSYTPAPDGSIPAARIEAFLAVRSELVEVCAKLTAFFAQMEGMKRFDGQDDVSNSEVLREALKTVKGAMGIGPSMGELFETRNRALLSAEMGLGEYAYIFFTAYHQQLLENNEYDEFMGGEAINSRISNDFVKIFERQLAAIHETSTPDLAGIAAIETEIEAMEHDHDRIPWQNGLPAAISGSLEPYRAQLDEAFCPAITAIELAINEKRGLSIQAR